MPPESLRLPQQTKEQLLRLKRSTGIKQWNILCRWALCTSLTDDRLVNLRPSGETSNVEMTWKVFAGTYAGVYESLIRSDLHKRGLQEVDFAALLQAHIARGTNMLALEPPRIRALAAVTG